MDYFTTGEVAKRLNMSVRTLRYYDQINLVVPTLKDENGKRFYSENDLLLLQKISLLTETSMPLKDIEQIINDLSIEKVLTVHKMQLETDRKALEQSLLHTQTLTS
ncbi:MerR family transcriptional regulator [Lysinibacillus sp. KU-BSD001]|uniref:MerR family transcriptional regulator n=1 Tax=Lysinibacillus sp. KU-BSD001 TaxID=3141328 RepID=UPI0036EB2B24